MPLVNSNPLARTQVTSAHDLVCSSSIILIGLFTDAYFPIIGGVSVSVRTLRDELVKLGHEVFVITNNHDDALEEKNVVRAGGHKLPMKAMGEFRVGKVTKTKVKEISDLNLDIIHCHTEFTMGRLGRRVAKKNHIPICYSKRG